MRYVSLVGFLFAFWLALSGHYTPFLVATGGIIAVLCVLAAIRMRVADAEGHSVELLWGAITYYPWLVAEIAKSTWGVTKIILHPSLPISPTMTVVRASQKTNAGVATYANSITLTPGTITVGVNGKDLTVQNAKLHAASAIAARLRTASALLRKLGIQADLAATAKKADPGRGATRPTASNAVQILRSYPPITGDPGLNMTPPM